MKETKSFNIYLFQSSFLIMALVIIPILFFYVALNYLTTENISSQINAFRRYTTTISKQIEKDSNPEKFLCYRLTDLFKSSDNPQEFQKKVVHLSKIIDEKIIYILTDQKNQVITNQDLSQEKKLLWVKAGKILQTAFSDAGRRISFSFPEQTLLEKLLGPHFFPGRLFNSSDIRPKFIYPDAGNNFPLAYLNGNSKFMAMVFFDHSILNSKAGIKQTIEDFKNENKTVLWQDSSGKISGSLPKAVAHKKILTEMISLNKTFLNRENELFVLASTSSGDKLLITKKLKLMVKSPKRLTLLLFLITSFITLIFLKSSSSNSSFSNLSIKWQILALLLLSAGLPSLFLSIVTLDYLQQKQKLLIKEAHQKCIKYTQNVEFRFPTELSRLVNSINKTDLFLQKSLKNKKLDKTLIKDLSKKLPKSAHDFRLISSSTETLVTKDAKIVRGRVQEQFSKKWSFTERIKLEFKMAARLSAFYLNIINKTPQDPRKSAETEMFAEMAYQKPYYEVINDYISNTKEIAYTGWGDRPFLYYLDLISAFTQNIQDYTIMYLFTNSMVSDSFISRCQENLNRNPDDIKMVIKIGVMWGTSNPEFEDPDFRKILSGLSKHPSTEPEVKNIWGKDWVYAGFVGTNLTDTAILAFYPLEKINNKIRKEMENLIFSSFFGLLIILGLALVASQSFILPMKALHVGAEALKERNLSFKLPDMGSNEFGQMAKIFNKSFQEFEELSIASIVQSRLFPSQTIETSPFSLYGKSIPMADLGGDIYDFFEIDENRFGVLIGDVAGHGVGASLIMAMAKAGLIYSSDILDQPVKVMAGLHNMVCETRTKKQRKIMTCQYICIDKKNQTAKYSNAGGCSPILVNAEKGTADEISLPAPVLGAFKKSKFSEIDLFIEPGTGLVFYTDGIIETTNSKGEEIGYDGFKKILLESYDQNAEKFYNNVYERYCQWLGDFPPQDDLTLVFLINQTKK